MKLSKYAKLVKRTGELILLRVDNAGVWLGTGTGLYRCEGVPETIDVGTIQVLLDFDEKTKERVHAMVEDNMDPGDVYGMDICDFNSEEQHVQRYGFAINYKGTYVNVMICENGDLLFVDETLLAPVSDILEKSEYAQLTARKARNGERYLVVKDGMITVAAVMPVKFLNQEFFADLQDFEGRCASQLQQET